MRQPTGIAWSELQIRRWQTLQLMKTTTPNIDILPLRRKSSDIEMACEVIEIEFPDAVAFERELWAEAVWLKQEAENNDRSDNQDAGGALVERSDEGRREDDLDRRTINPVGLHVPGRVRDA
jgi:hypothetical protein